MDAAVLLSAPGALSRMLRWDFKIPVPFYEALSICLRLAIGLKGGAELARQHPLALLPRALAVLVLGAVMPLLAYPVLRDRAFPALRCWRYCQSGRCIHMEVICDEHTAEVLAEHL